MRFLAYRLAATFVVLAAFATGAARADTVNAAVAANLKSAFAGLVADYQAAHPGDTIVVTYGSSGKFVAQIANGAPFDLFFSADMTYPQDLVAKGLAAGDVQRYAVGHLVLWSLRPALGTLPLKQLPKAGINRFAIANPAVAPYGQRAREALQHEGAWDALQPMLVLGENITQAAQFVDTGAADAGLVALSSVLGPELRGKGAWTRVPDDWHAPLDQGFVVLKPGADKPLAKSFAAYVASAPARAILKKFGFDAPK